jgi:hypothetical protein
MVNVTFTVPCPVHKHRPRTSSTSNTTWYQQPRVTASGSATCRSHGMPRLARRGRKGNGALRLSSDGPGARPSSAARQRLHWHGRGLSPSKIWSDGSVMPFTNRSLLFIVPIGRSYLLKNDPRGSQALDLRRSILLFVLPRVDSCRWPWPCQQLMRQWPLRHPASSSQRAEEGANSQHHPRTHIPLCHYFVIELS